MKQKSQQMVQKSRKLVQKTPSPNTQKSLTTLQIGKEAINSEKVFFMSEYTPTVYPHTPPYTILFEE